MELKQTINIEFSADKKDHKIGNTLTLHMVDGTTVKYVLIEIDETPTNAV